MSSSLSVDEIRQLSEKVSDEHMRTELSVPAIHCGGCVKRIESTLHGLDGITSARVNLTSKRVFVEWLPSSNPQQFITALEELGFEPSLCSSQQNPDDKILKQYLTALAVSGFAAGNVMLLSIAVWSGASGSMQHLFHWLSALIAIPAVLFAGQVFFRSAWQSVRKGKTNMDVPITIGIVLTCALSLYDTITNAGGVYFEAATMLVFFLLIGRTLDYLMRAKAANAVNGLRALEPVGVERLGAAGRWEFTTTDNLKRGDEIRVPVNSRLPVDGVVLSGTSDVDTELVDGESYPRTVGMNDYVLAGTLNLSAPLKFEVTAPANESYLAKMRQLVVAGEQQKGEHQLVADKAAALYAPLVHSAAIIAFVAWYIAGRDIHQATTIAVSVLIITCPCALALAVPMVQTIAARTLFNNGVLMKNGAALEKLRLIDAIVFDKTGTLTETTPEISSASAYNDDALAIACQLTADSEHPLAKAVRQYALARGTLGVAQSKMISRREIVGKGIEAQIGDSHYRFGQSEWADSNSDGAPPQSSEHPEVVLSRDRQSIAMFVFSNKLRIDAVSAVQQLQKDIANITLLSGDREPTVRAVAKQLGLRSYQSQCTPEQKLQIIQAQAGSGAHVLMVGDGLNDTASMAGAMVSMAPGNAATATRLQADFVLLNSRLTSISDTMVIANKASRLVQQNFFIAIAYNAIALPLAFAGMVSPLIAALAMSSSSLLVVANAMRINQAKPKVSERMRLKEVMA